MSVITGTPKHVLCALHNFVITEPLFADLLVKLLGLVLIQSQRLNDSFKLSILSLIIAGRTFTTRQFFNVPTYRVRRVLKRLRISERCSDAAIGQHVARVGKPYRNAILGRKRGNAGAYAAMLPAILAAPLNSWDGVNVIERGLGSLLPRLPVPDDRRCSTTANTSLPSTARFSARTRASGVASCEYRTQSRRNSCRRASCALSRAMAAGLADSTSFLPGCSPAAPAGKRDRYSLRE
jgi:hypothetical protein